MNFIDIAIIALLAWGAISGYIKGFLTQLISFGAVFLGIYLAFLFSDLISGWVTDYFKVSAKWSMAVASFAIFVGVFILLHITGRIISRSFENTSVGTVNRILGMAFGVLKIFIVACAILWLVSTINQTVKLIPDHMIADSKLFDMWRIVPWIFPFVKEMI